MHWACSCIPTWCLGAHVFRALNFGQTLKNKGNRSPTTDADRGRLWHYHNAIGSMCNKLQMCLRRQYISFGRRRSDTRPAGNQMSDLFTVKRRLTSCHADDQLQPHGWSGLATLACFSCINWEMEMWAHGSGMHPAWSFGPSLRTRNDAGAQQEGHGGVDDCERNAQTTTDNIDKTQLRAISLHVTHCVSLSRLGLACLSCPSKVLKVGQLPSKSPILNTATSKYQTRPKHPNKTYEWIDETWDIYAVTQVSAASQRLTGNSCAKSINDDSLAPTLALWPPSPLALRSAQFTQLVEKAECCSVSHFQSALQSDQGATSNTTLIIGIGRPRNAEFRRWLTDLRALVCFLPGQARLTTLPSCGWDWSIDGSWSLKPWRVVITGLSRRMSTRMQRAALPPICIIPIRQAATTGRTIDPEWYALGGRRAITTRNARDTLTVPPIPWSGHFQRTLRKSERMRLHRKLDMIGHSQGWAHLMTPATKMVLRWPTRGHQSHVQQQQPGLLLILLS
jgi:hypothetical protein